MRQLTPSASPIGGETGQRAIPASESGDRGRIITPLRDVGYLSFLGPVPRTTGISDMCTSRSCTIPPWELRGVGKGLSPTEGSRGLINEIAGYLLTRERRIPQPPAAFVAQVPLKRLQDPPGWIVSARNGGMETCPAFATARLDGLNAGMPVPDADVPALLREIAAWPFCAAAIALDEHLGNGDRHLNNLIRTKRGIFALIDHGKLCSKPGTID